MKNSTYCISIILHHSLTLNSYKACPISYLHYITLKKIGKSLPLRRNIFLIHVLCLCLYLVIDEHQIHRTIGGGTTDHLASGAVDHSTRIDVFRRFLLWAFILLYKSVFISESSTAF
jgi:hypothetical protein